MKSSLGCLAARLLVVGLSCFAIVIAWLAPGLGVDPGGDWGPTRLYLFFFGVGGLILCLPQLRQVLKTRPRPPIGMGKPSSAAAAALPARRTQQRQIGETVLVVAALGATLASYFWFFAPALSHPAERTTEYFDLLARGFVDGELSLTLEPDPRLAAIDNPYAPWLRESIPVLHDAAYFEGRYSLYYGPAPAVFLSLIRRFTGAGAGDEWLVLIGLAASAIFGTLILLRVWKASFSALPIWLLASGVLLIGLAHPLLWSLDYPRYDTVSMLSGAGLLLAGLTFALYAFDQPGASAGRLTLAGSLWGLAVASRLLLLPAVLFLAGLVTVALMRRSGGRAPDLIPRVASVTLPILLTLGLLAAYNYARFQDPLETGLRYQMTGNDLGEFNGLFRSSYLPLNAYNYLARPFRVGGPFPFLHLTVGARGLPLLGRGSPPGMHEPEQISGLLLTFPFVLFALPFFLRLVCPGGRVRASRSVSSGDGPEAQSAPGGQLDPYMAIAGGFVLVALPLFTFYYLSTRYVLDFIALLGLASSIGAWIAYDAARGNSRHRVAVAALIILGLVASLGTSFLLALSDFPGW